MYIMIVHTRVFNETTAGIERNNESTEIPSHDLTYETYFVPTLTKPSRPTNDTGMSLPPALRRARDNDYEPKSSLNESGN